MEKKQELLEIRKHIDEYSEGSESLKQLLYYLNDNGVITFGCCAGHDGKNFVYADNNEKLYYDDPMIGFYIYDSNDTLIGNNIIDFFKENNFVTGYCDICSINKKIKFSFHFREECQKFIDRDFGLLLQYLKLSNKLVNNYIEIYVAISQIGSTYQLENYNISNISMQYNFDSNKLFIKSIDNLNQMEKKVIKALNINKLNLQECEQAINFSLEDLSFLITDNKQNSIEI